MLLLFIFSSPLSLFAQTTPDTSCYDVEKKDTIYKTTCTMLEEMPKFPGGDDSLFKFIVKNVHYPKQALYDGVQGKVFISFIVEKEGGISNVQLLKGAQRYFAEKKKKEKEVEKMNQDADLLNEEALRVMNLLPPFATPGKENGKPVRVKYTLPINFRFK